MEILIRSLSLIFSFLYLFGAVIPFTYTQLQCTPVRTTISKCSELNGKGRGNFSSFHQILRTQIPFVNEVLEGVKLSAETTTAPQECIDSLVYIMCLIAAPPCNQDTNLPVTICNDSCAAYKQLQAERSCDEWNQRLTDLRSSSTLPDVRVLVNTYFGFDCENPLTYYFRNFTRYYSDGCTDLFSPEIQSTLLSRNSSAKTESGGTTSPSKSINGKTLLLAIIIPSLFVLVTLSLFTIICLCCYCSHRRKRKKSARDLQLLLEQVVASPQKSERLSVNKRENMFKDVLILYETLTLGDELGQGAFGKVFKGEYKSENGPQAVAVKTLKNMASHNEINEFLSESAIMKDFHHPHVLGLVGVVFDTPDGVPYLVLPFMEFGNLKIFLKSKRIEGSNNSELPEGLDLSNLSRMCIDIAQGMEYLAEKRFTHRDLAARNCMVDEHLLIKVGDFGLARDIYSTDYYRSTDKDAKLPIKWMPPEAFNDKISNEKTDVWSYGVTCWEVFSLGRTPYPTVPNSEILDYLSNGGRLEKPGLCPDEIFELMENCWDPRPENRPKFSKLVEKLTEYWDDKYGYI